MEIGEINKLEFSKAFTTVVNVACLILPPFLFLFEFQTAIFTSLNDLKLLLLALSISLPGFLVMNIFFKLSIESLHDTKMLASPISRKMLFSHRALISSILNSICYYVPYGSKFFFKMSLRFAILEVVSMHFLLIILVLCLYKVK